MMSLAHFNGCMTDVSTDYAIDIANAIAEEDDDEITLTLCAGYWLYPDKRDLIVNKLKEYYKNA